MSTLLPVLNSENPAMCLCSVCPKPGSCCHDFILEDTDDKFSFAYLKTRGREAALDKMREEGLPFLPLRIRSTFKGPGSRLFVSYSYKCSNLLPNGRCGDYENRPQLCRDFVPDSDWLCIFTKMREK